MFQKEHFLNIPFLRPIHLFNEFCKNGGSYRIECGSTFERWLLKHYHEIFVHKIYFGIPFFLKSQELLHIAYNKISFYVFQYQCKRICFLCIPYCVNNAILKPWKSIIAENKTGEIIQLNSIPEKIKG